MVEICYEFLRPGEVVEPRRRWLYVDLGNRKEPGIVDHHFGEYQHAHFECSTSLIYGEPELVTGWIRPEELRGTVHVCVHESPDFDCIAATYLVVRLLSACQEGHALPEGWHQWGLLLAQAASAVDAGNTRIVPPENGVAPITIYPAVLGLVELEEELAKPRREKWTWRLEQGHRVLHNALDQALREGVERLEQLDLRGRLPEGLEIELRVDRRMQAFRLDALRLGLLPGGSGGRPLDGIREVRLLDRTDFRKSHMARIAFVTDPESGGGFFKSLVRGAFHDRVQATCVFFTRAEDYFTGASAWVQPIISVDPESPYSLRGLGQLLEAHEKRTRHVQGVPRVGPPRPGFDSPDPWFNGRSFDYTIVDAPRWGTVLSPEKIREIVLDWEAWHQRCHVEVVRQALSDLRTPLSCKRERETTLREMISALVHLYGKPSGKDDVSVRTAWQELPYLLDEQDLEVLEEFPELLGINAFAVGLLDSRQPCLRVWILRQVRELSNDRSLDAYLRSIDRRDLRIPIHLSTYRHLSAEEQKELCRVLLYMGPLTPDHAVLVDALGTIDRTTPPELLEPCIVTCQKAAEVPGLWRSLHFLKESVSELDVPQAWAETVCRSVEKADSSLRLLDRTEYDLPLSSEEADETLLESTVSFLGSLRIRHECSIPDVGLSLQLEELLERLVGLHGVDRVAAELSEIRELPHLRAVPSWTEIFARRQLAGESEWALWMALDEATSPRKATQARQWHRDRREHEIAQLFLQLSRATARLRAHPSPETPAYMAPVLAMRLLPVLHGRGEAWRHVSGLERLELHALDLGLSAPESDLPASRVSELGMRVRTELLQRLPRHQLLGHLDASLHRAQVLLLGRQILSLCARETAGVEPSREEDRNRSMVGFTYALIDWILHLRCRDSQSCVADLVAMRNRLPIEGSLGRSLQKALATVEWAIGCLECALQAFEDDTVRPTTSAGQLRSHTRSLRARLREGPGGGLAFLVTVALEDALTYLEQKLWVLDRLEKAKKHHDLTAIDDLTGDVLVADALDGLQKDWRAIRAVAGEDSQAGLEKVEGAEALLRLQRRIQAAGETPEGRSCREFTASLAKAGWEIAKDRNSARQRQRASTILEKASLAGDDHLEHCEEKAYSRTTGIQHLDGRVVDRVLQETLEWQLGEYELNRARRLIERHRPKPFDRITGFWLSNYVAVFPALFVVLFLFARPGFWELGLVLEVLGAGALAATLWPLLREGSRQLRSNLGLPQIPRPSPGCDRRYKMLDRMTWQLVMPNSLIAVLVGVVGVAFTDELDERIALHIKESQMLILLVAMALASFWALGQFAHRQGQMPTARNVCFATARLFTYAFVIVMAMNLFVSPLMGIHPEILGKTLSIDTRSSDMPNWLRTPRSGNSCLDVPSPKGKDVPHEISTRLPLCVETPLTPTNFYPRHLLLYAALGMFAGIFVNVLFRRER